MCVLHVTGKKLDPTVAWDLQPYRVFQAGNPRVAGKPDGPLWDTSGFSVAVSDAPWTDMVAQVEDASSFLDRHAEHLKKLGDGGGVEKMWLDFPVTLRIGESVFAQFESFPGEFVQKAGALGLGIEISSYACDESDECGAGQAG